MPTKRKATGIAKTSVPVLAAEDTLLAVEIFRETLRGMEFLRGVEPAVTMFGSARTPRGHPFYEMARATGAAFAKAGYGVITGGGPGLMEASNRGAREARGRSVGCKVTL